MSAATAGSITLGSSPTTIFDATKNGGPCAAISVANRDAALDVLVSVAGLHTEGAFATIAPGASMTFSLGGANYGSLTKAVAKAAVGSPAINWTIAGQH